MANAQLQAVGECLTNIKGHVAECSRDIMQNGGPPSEYFKWRVGIECGRLSALGQDSLAGALETLGTHLYQIMFGGKVVEYMTMPNGVASARDSLTNVIGAVEECVRTDLQRSRPPIEHFQECVDDELQKLSGSGEAELIAVMEAMRTPLSDLMAEGW